MKATGIKTPASVMRSSLLVAALLSTIALAACNKQTAGEAAGANTSPSAGAVTTSNVADKVAQARTPEDHEAIASYYEARARQAQRETGDNRELQGRYERRWQRDHHPMASGPRDHLGPLTEGHESEARHYEAMAAWHHEMARSAASDSTARE